MRRSRSGRPKVSRAPIEAKVAATTAEVSVRETDEAESGAEQIDETGRNPTQRRLGEGGGSGRARRKPRRGGARGGGGGGGSRSRPPPPRTSRGRADPARAEGGA